MSSSYRLFTPSYPQVIVERLPRQQKSASGIILTGDKNKPLHEGVVLKTWAPWRKIFDESTEVQPKYRTLIPEKIFSFMHDVKVVNMVSQFKPGDHVVFPHWAGFEDPSEPDVLFLKEHGSLQSEGGIILGKIEHDAEKLRRELVEAVVLNQLPGSYTEDLVNLIDALDRDFIFVPRFSKTLSGAPDEAL